MVCFLFQCFVSASPCEIRNCSRFHPQRVQISWSFRVYIYNTFPKKLQLNEMNVDILFLINQHEPALYRYTLGGFFLASYDDSPAGIFDEVLCIDL